MKLYNTLTSESFQPFYLVTDSGKRVDILLFFMPTQECWRINISCDNFSINNIKVCSSLNLLDKWHNIIDFGISIYTKDGLDPWRLEDFKDGYASFYLLNENDLKEVTGVLNGE